MGAGPLIVKRGLLEFLNVTFSYTPEKVILSKIIFVPFVSGLINIIFSHQRWQAWCTIGLSFASTCSWRSSNEVAAWLKNFVSFNVTLYLIIIWDYKKYLLSRVKHQIHTAIKFFTNNYTIIY